jgi:hypothetical protein
MTLVLGRRAAVTINGRSLSAYATTITLTRTAAAIDSTPWGARVKTYLPGLKEGTAKIEGIYYSSETLGPGAVLRRLIGAAPVTLTYQAEGSGGGRPTVTVDAIVTQYEESPSVADMVKWSVALQLTGDIRDETQPGSYSAGGYGVGGYGINGYGE